MTTGVDRTGVDDTGTRRARSGSDDSLEVTSARPGARVAVAAVVGAARWWRVLLRAARDAVHWCRGVIRPAGALVLLTAVLGLTVGWAFGWVEAITAGAVATVLLAMAVPFLFGARAYAIDVQPAHERIVAGAGTTVTVTVRVDGTRAALPGSVEVPVGDGLVEFAVPLLRPGRTWSRVIELPPQPRGILRLGPPLTVRADPIGLLRREHAFDRRRELYVHPRTVALPSTSSGLVRDLDGRPTRHLVDDDMSFHAIREYAPGDARRQIHWKSTAKTGRLMVRQYEQTRRSRMAVILALAEAEYASADEFELAVSTAASVSVRAVVDARDLDIVTGAEIPRVVRGRLRAIRRLPAASPRVLLDAFSTVARSAAIMPLTQVCRLTAEAEPGLSIVVLVTGSVGGLAQLRQAALAFPAGAGVIAVVCDERAHPRSQIIGPLTVLTVGTLDDVAGLLLRGVTA